MVVVVFVVKVVVLTVVVFVEVDETGLTVLSMAEVVVVVVAEVVAVTGDALDVGVKLTPGILVVWMLPAAVVELVLMLLLTVVMIATLTAVLFAVCFFIGASVDLVKLSARDVTVVFLADVVSLTCVPAVNTGVFILTAVVFCGG